MAIHYPALINLPARLFSPLLSSKRPHNLLYGLIKA